MEKSEKIKCTSSRVLDIINHGAALERKKERKERKGEKKYK